MLCIEDNETRGQALLLIESLRAFGGRYAGSEVLAVAPRAGLGVDRETRTRLEELEVTYHEEPLNTICPEYGSANRVYSAAWAAANSGADTLFVLDSDTFFLDEPEPLGDGWDLAARPVDVKGSATGGPGDPFEPYWQAICGLAGCAIETLPFIETVFGREPVRASYNGGYSVVRRSSGILESAAELFTRSVRRGLRPYRGQGLHRVFASTGPVAPRAAEYWGSNQAILSVAAAAAAARVRLLDRRYNLPLHHLAEPAGWSEDWRGLRPVHVHYHWMLRAAHRPRALTVLEQLGAAPEKLAFLASRSPIGERRRRPARPPAPAAPEGERQLVIAGMHRSGTSLVASVLRQSGLDIGRELLGPGPGNRRGHFEDQQFWQLHEDMLAAAGCTALTADDHLAPPPGEDFAARARALAAGRRGLQLWGWKDPRTCLFLDFWHPLLSAPAYLFLYRHPLEVALSLRRRATESEVRLDPWAGLRAWEVYNRRLLAFMKSHPERCFLAQVPALTADLPSFVGRLAAELGLPLRELGDFAGFSPEELTESFAGEPGGEPWEELIPEALALYRRLEEHADLPGLPAAAGAAPEDGGDLEKERARTAGREIAALLEDLRQTRPGPGQRPASARPTLGWQRRLLRLQTELAKERQTSAELRHRLDETDKAFRHALLNAAEAAAARDQLAARLGDIAGSRAFRLLDRWWRLLARLRGI